MLTAMSRIGTSHRFYFQIKCNPTVMHLQVVDPLSSFSLSVLQTVPSLEDEPHPEVGGCVARAGMSGTYRLVRSPGGERPLPQVITLGTGT